MEAKLLQPAIDADVTLYEDVARTARYIAKNKGLRQISKKKPRPGIPSVLCHNPHVGCWERCAIAVMKPPESWQVEVAG